MKESDKYLGKGEFHTIITGKAKCPECGATDGVVEQGYEHNHRHYCTDCDTTWWLTRG